MTSEELSLIKYIAGGIGALLFYLMLFTDFFNNISRRGTTTEVEVVPEDLSTNIRDIIDELREHIDNDTDATRSDILRWERSLVDALADNE